MEQLIPAANGVKITANKLAVKDGEPQTVLTITNELFQGDVVTIPVGWGNPVNVFLNNIDALAQTQNFGIVRAKLLGEPKQVPGISPSDIPIYRYFLRHLNSDAPADYHLGLESVYMHQLAVLSGEVDERRQTAQFVIGQIASPLEQGLSLEASLEILAFSALEGSGLEPILVQFEKLIEKVKGDFPKERLPELDNLIADFKVTATSNGLRDKKGLLRGKQTEILQLAMQAKFNLNWDNMTADEHWSRSTQQKGSS